ncbi:6,7-dimethyl-8-ribityllumazine synthase [Gammaproteobacteria bacterium]|nr:6,7-dimethyl-8-ribityllumazine synthase [Gammaproteobacteria bacterium]
MSNIDNNETDTLISSSPSKRSYTLIDLDLNEYKDTSDSHIDIVVLYSNYNLFINQSILNGYLNELDIKKFLGKVAIINVPGGAFELPVLASRIINKYNPKVSLIIGCIVKGDTKHYDFLSQTVTNAISTLSLQKNTPILNGVLTVESDQQAIDRAGKKLNKGSEYANVTLEILEFSKKL